jgi:hypothetical protein
VADVQCVHHWVFPDQNGHWSVGYCKICGQEKIAVNSVDDKKPIRMGDLRSDTSRTYI